MNVLNPLGARAALSSATKPLAPRPRSLRGLRIGAEDLMVIVAGGPGTHSSIAPTFGATRSVTEEIV